MFARMLVGDVFLHGIGGGKYDELTDVLIQRFYSVQPPRYLVLSATLRLPLPHSAVSEADVRKLAPAMTARCLVEPAQAFSG